ncbi:hypothetical protein V3C99_009199 [Haemonchus contortus]|uniref:Secreted protein n=1 Tax=Haemonchus contortus TaxID=6289 RepID=A0A7I4YIQ4_HAECO|nr:Protein T21D12.14 [Haemonchus contortus]
MRILLCLLLCGSSCAFLIEGQKEPLINMHSNFGKPAKVCNINDETNFCQQIVVDHRVSLVAVSYKCECPKGWICPTDIDETPANTECQYVESKYWRKCQLKCTPLHEIQTSTSSSEEEDEQEEEEQEEEDDS